MSIASGAVFEANGPVALKTLSVDASGAGNGTVRGFTFAETGTLYVTGLGAFAGRFEIPMPLENCTGLGNVSKWNLIVNGKVDGRYHVTASVDGIAIMAAGMMIIVK